MMKSALAAFLLLMTYSSAYATTAVLCGDPARVDEDNDTAAVWLIFGNPDSRSSDEITVTFKGKEASVTAVKVDAGKVTIDVVRPKATVILEERFIDYVACDGESLFSLQLVSGTRTKTVDECRCFSD
ncbi:MAG: hypothetical protein NDJ90_01970 [Oligoflexia bacterium]|nr:hypothetical protein [Oligoflexia bacterium]